MNIAGDFSLRRMSRKAIATIGGLLLLCTQALAIDPNGEVHFDTFFAGTTINAKIAAMNTWSQGFSASTARPTVVFEAKNYAFSTPIQLWSGLRLRGVNGKAVREYSTATSFTWQGAEGTSVFVFTGSQTGQSYPRDGSPRDIHVESILFNSTSTTHFLPKHDPTTYDANGAGNVLWMSNFHNVGWKNFATIAWGWFDGVTISGTVHFQGMHDTPFYLGGSENNVFADGFSFGDSTAAYPVVTDGLPFFRSILSKSKIGRLMFTSRRTGYPLSIEGGHGLLVEGTAFDAQDSDPMYGSAIRISGGEGIRILGCSFKGVMSNPSAAAGGTAANRGWITITGGSQIVIDGNDFHRGGNSQAPTSTPLVWVGPGVGANEVKWGLNTVSGYAGDQARIAESAAGKIVKIDPSVVTDILP